MENSESQQFLKELGIKDTSQEVYKGPEEVQEEEDKPQEESEEDKEVRLNNRKERREYDKIRKLREENIALTTRLQTLSEVGKFREEVGDDTLKEVEAIFGTDTPEKLQATNILKKALSGMSETAVQKAITQIEEKQQKESQSSQQEIEEEEETLSDMMDDVEDEYGIDFSNQKDRNGFLTALEEASPKDKDGNIIEYADYHFVAKNYLSNREKSSSRARELASRSMTQSGTSQPSTLETDAREKYLKDNGII